MYYWCKLEFDENSAIKRRIAIEYAETYAEFIRIMARHVNTLAWKYDFRKYPLEIKIREAISELASQQNLTGKDLTGLPTGHGYYDRNGDWVSFYSYYPCRDRQFCEITDNRDGKTCTLRVIDIRNLEDDILKCILMNNIAPHPEPEWMRRKRRKQKRTHKSYGGYHMQANRHNTLSLIDRGLMRTKYAAAFLSSYSYDPKIHDCENNWKQTRCRHQWEWHKPRHKSTMLPPEIDGSLFDDDETLDLEGDLT